MTLHYTHSFSTASREPTSDEETSFLGARALLPTQRYEKTHCDLNLLISKTNKPWSAREEPEARSRLRSQ